MKKLTTISRVLVALAALSMISAYYVPLWQILMWAPQYPEGLDMKIWINNLTGDVKIISALNHYIGMRHIEVSMFPEFKYMIYIVGFVIAFGLITALTNRRIMLILFNILIIACGSAALIDFYLWGYDYGHNLDPTAPIVVPGMSYQPPLIGTKQLLNFTAFSGPDIGGWIFLVAGLLTIAALAYEIYRSRINNKNVTTALAVGFTLTLISCANEPEPLRFGQDGCHACKMTLMDNKFGAEILTRKGKVYKFDDVNCMLGFVKTGEVKADDIQQFLIIDFASGGQLIDATNAFYVKSESVKSPMASGVAAFSSKAALEKFSNDANGTQITWNELKTQFQ
jgi:copper chaperone NosL